MFPCNTWLYVWWQHPVMQLPAMASLSLLQSCSHPPLGPWWCHLRGVFDTVDEASYIPDVSAYLKLLETRVWPLLGISPTVHNTGGHKCAGMP